MVAKRVSKKDRRRHVELSRGEWWGEGWADVASMSVSRRQSRASRLFLDEQSGKSSVREATAGEVSNCPEFPSSQATTMG